MIAITYRLAHDTPDAYGITLSDVWYKVAGKRINPTLVKAGDYLDLEKLEMVSFVKATLDGTIRDLVLRGTLITKQVDVSELKANYISSLQGEMGANRNDLIKPKRPVQIREIEPGVMAPISVDPDSNSLNDGDEKAEPPVPAAKESSTEEIEPGSTAPKSKQPRAKDGTEPVPKKKASKNKKSTKGKGATSGSEPTKTPAVETPESGEIDTSQASWKDGKDYAQQKASIQTSSDKDFLSSVKTDAGETTQFKKLAGARLTELST